MFSLAFVCLQGRGGPHVTITHDALDLTVQPPLPHRHQTWAPPGPPTPLLMTSHDHFWRPVQTCSLEDCPTSTDIWWPKQIWLASGRYASYWNALLFEILIIDRKGKVMFSLACVCSKGGRVSLVPGSFLATGPMSFWGWGIPSLVPDSF